MCPRGRPDRRPVTAAVGVYGAARARPGGAAGAPSGLFQIHTPLKPYIPGLFLWIRLWLVEDGRAAYGMSGQGRLGSTTIRLGSRGLTFAGVALPDLTPPPKVLKDRVVFTQTAGGHTGAPVPRPVTQPPGCR